MAACNLWSHAAFFSGFGDVKFSHLGAQGAAIKAKNLGGALFPTN